VLRTWLIDTSERRVMSGGELTARTGSKPVLLTLGATLNSRTFICFAASLAVAVTLCMPILGQTTVNSQLKAGDIVATVTDVNDDTVPNATVNLNKGDTNEHRTIVTSENGFFQFQGVKPGIPYQISISANILRAGHHPLLRLLRCNQVSSRF
jgi:hypothetical protein